MENKENIEETKDVVTNENQESETIQEAPVTVTEESTNEPEQEIESNASENSVEQQNDTEEKPEQKNNTKKKKKEKKTKPIKEKKPKEAKTDKEKKPKNKFEAKKKRHKIAYVITSIILWTMCIFLLIVCGSNIMQQKVHSESHVGFFGIGNAIVVSPSMRPDIDINDVVLYKQVPEEEIQKGDIVVYEREKDGNKELIIHRVKSIQGGYMIAKGDMNSIEDEAVKTSAIVGKHICTIPKVGGILRQLSDIKTACIVLAIVLVCIIGYIVWGEIYKRRLIKKLSDNKENQDALKYFFDI